MEIEDQRVDEALVVFQGKAESLLQKRQKLIDGELEPEFSWTATHITRSIFQLGEDFPWLLRDLYQ